MKEKSVRGEETQEICLCVADDSNFLSPFFADGYPIISEEIAEYFNHNIKRRAKWRSLKIKIASGCIDEQERVIYANAIKNYYTTEHSEIKRELRRNMIASVIMTLIAAAVFTIAIALENSSSAGTVILNMLDVLAWVFMWEAVDKFFFQRHALRVKSLRYQALTEAEVIFEDLNIPKERSDIKMILISEGDKRGSMKKTLLRILWGIVGVILIAAGIVCFCNPDITTAALAIIFGVVLLISGITDIVIFAKYNRFMFGAAWFLVDGILTVMLSVFLIFNAEFTALTMPLIFGMWLVFSGVDRFMMSFDLQRLGVRGWGWMTALGILMTLAGFFVFFDPVFGAVTITAITGVLLIIRGVAAIVQAIMAGRYLY